MAGELSFDRQIEWAEAAVSEAKTEVQRILDQLSGDVLTVSRRFASCGEMAGSAPGALGGRVNELHRWYALLAERQGRLRQLRSWMAGS